MWRAIHKHIGGNEVALTAALILQLVGILALASATHSTEYSGPSSILIRQIVWVVFGLIVFGLIQTLSARILQAFAYIIYGAAAFCLLLVLVMGEIGMGATRWLEIGPIQFQPSEIAKVALILALARLLTERFHEWNQTKTLVAAVGMALVCTGLVIVEPDLGTSLVYPVILFLMLFWSGASPVVLLIMASPLLVIPAGFHWLTLFAVLAAIAVVMYFTRTRLLVTITVLILLLGLGISAPRLWSHLHQYQRNRIISFINPDADPMGSGYQLIQSKVTIGSGGITGKGFLKGTQTHLKFLPEQHTDFIFSVWGEEFGFLGSLLVVTAYFVLVFKAFQLSGKVRNLFMSAMCAGIGAFFLIHYFVNIGMTLGMLPVTGLPLPFLSYGGTMIISTWIMVGLLTLAARHWREY
jgi:rod shape determining protein RodA